MSENSLGGLYIAEQVMDRNVREAHREAESQRLLRQAKAGDEGGYRFYFGMLAWLGHRLTVWGEYLQARYLVEQRPDPCAS